MSDSGVAHSAPRPSPDPSTVSSSSVTLSSASVSVSSASTINEGVTSLPHASFVPPPLRSSIQEVGLCKRALRQAAQDGAPLYLSLLPVELRAEVDRLCMVWWHQVSESATVREVDAPAYADVDRVHFTLPNGAEVVVIAQPAATRILHFERGLTAPPRELKIDDTFLRVITAPGEAPPLLLFGRSDPLPLSRRLRDTEGRLLRCWQRGTPLESDSWHEAIEDNGDWVRHCRTFTNVHHLDVSYELPADYASRSPPDVTGRWWAACTAGGVARLATGGFLSGGHQWLQVWDLASGALMYENARCGATRVAFVHVGALVTSMLDKLQIRALSAGAPLLLEVEGLMPSFEQNDRAIMFAPAKSAAANLIYFWDPLVPNRLSVLDFLDWRIVWRTRGVLMAHRGAGAETLLWHFASGCGVRTETGNTGISLLVNNVEFCHGAFFITSHRSTHIVRLPPTYTGDALAGARPLPTHVPSEIPMVRAQILRLALSDSTQSDEANKPWTPVRLVCGSAATAPMLRHRAVMYRFCDY